jgi:hypothetical protein
MKCYLYTSRVDVLTGRLWELCLKLQNTLSVDCITRQSDLQNKKINNIRETRAGPCFDF